MLAAYINKRLIRHDGLLQLLDKADVTTSFARFVHRFAATTYSGRKHGYALPDLS
jgi:hypothetical protein